MLPLRELLEREAHRFGFYQAVSLLEEYHRRRGESDNAAADGTIALSAHTPLVFPPSDVASCTFSGDTSRLALNFMGLVGVSSPPSRHRVRAPK